MGSGRRSSCSCDHMHYIRVLRSLLERKELTLQSEKEEQLRIIEVICQAGHLMLCTILRPPDSSQVQPT